MEAEPQPQGASSSREAGARDCGLLATVAPMAARNPAAVAAGPMTLVLPATVVPETPESPAVTAAPAVPTTLDAEKTPLTLVPSPPPSPGHSGQAHSPGDLGHGGGACHPGAVRGNVSGSNNTDRSKAPAIPGA